MPGLDLSQRKLPLLPEDWERAMCVVAHPDDIEYGAAAAVARWTSAGKTVTYLLVTRGEAGIDGMDPAECGPVREQEEIAGAKEVGVEVVEFLDYPDGMVEYGLPLRRDIARAIRQHRPDVLVSGDFGVRFIGGMTNQADHRAVGLALLDAWKDAANRWIFPELLAEGLEPWTARFVAYVGSATPSHGLDVSGHLPAAIRSLQSHKRYLEGLGPDAPDPTEFLPWVASASGAAIGADEGVLFDVHGLVGIEAG